VVLLGQQRFGTFEPSPQKYLNGRYDVVPIQQIRFAIIYEKTKPFVGKPERDLFSPLHLYAIDAVSRTVISVFTCDSNNGRSTEKRAADPHKVAMQH
jgi:hypothetical protein